ncbi:hypothetical protein PAE9249_03916 [Paenibacillus sp. CECT 9249]|nr:hypothetical protein PAE9249_03916 [Paenibacillus sp. CECT 9249]
MILIQLEKLVKYYKALADRNRIRMLILLAQGELNGLALAEKLAITPATVTHHIAKLREAGLIMERREKNTSYYGVNHYLLKQTDRALLHLLEQQRTGFAPEERSEKNVKLRQSVLRSFLASDGTLKQIPAQLKKKLIVLEYLVSGLEMGQKYKEREINEWIKKVHPDFATIRREFVMHHYMYRENDMYELNPREMWAKWEDL